MSGPQRGSPPTLEWIGVDRLTVDPIYQRQTDTAQSRRIVVGMVKCWDWTLCQPLTVSRRDDGALFIIDGQHRHTGALERGDIPHLPCVVISGANAKSEAQTFVALNTERQRLSQTDLFNAMLAAGDEDAKRIAGLIEETGWKIAKGTNAASYGAGFLSCAPMLVKAASSAGEAPVRNALTALREAYPDTPFNNAATLLKALIQIYRGDSLNGRDPDAFIESVGVVDPSDWDDSARDQRRKYPMLSRIESLAAAMIANFYDFERELAA